MHELRGPNTRPPTEPRRRRRAVMLACVVLLAVWAPAPSGTAAGAGLGTSGPTRSVVRVLRAAGQRQFIDCRGSKGPTVVLVSGLWGWSKDWAGQVPAWRRSGRVCTYDRPGLGASSSRSGTGEVDAGVHARELRALLRAAGERGPFILVGHSYGGLVVRAFANRYPRSVRGILLLDAVPPGMETDYPAYGDHFEEAGSLISLPRSSVATGFDRPLAGVPVVVLSAENPWWDAQKRVVWEQGQDRAARASGRAVRLVALGAGHQLQQTAPAAVDKALRVLRTGIRKRTFRGGCHRDWSAVGAQCRDLGGA